jgi:type II secretory pathway pseudopilin PulG
MKRLPAFTLLEAVLALFLVAMLGAYAFYVLQSMAHGSRHLFGRAGQQQEQLFFHAAVRADLDRAAALRVGSEGELLCEAEQGTTRYVTVPGGIARILPEGDSTVFALPVSATEMKLISEAIPLVQLWRITFTGGGSTAFSKTYAPAERVHERLDHVDQDPHSP